MQNLHQHIGFTCRSTPNVGGFFGIAQNALRVGVVDLSPRPSQMGRGLVS